MIVLNFFKPVLNALNNGKVIRSSTSLVLQILGVFSLVGGVYLLVEILKLSFDLPTKGAIAGVLLSIIFIAAVLAIAQILFYRAANVRDLDESQYTVIPILSILFRCFGEIYATLGVAIGVGGCFFIWISNYNPLYLFGNLGGLFPSLSSEGTFLGGLLFLVKFALFSFAIIIVSYFLAESTVVLVDIAKNIRQLLQKGNDR
ncbi:MAG: hypothetical protein ACP5US_11875 [Candidatus Kryptoniota bacterium]